MARKAKSPAPVATPVVEVEAVEVAANPFAGLLAVPVAPVAPAKVHAVAVGGETYVAANHVATYKGTRPVAVGGATYQLTGLPYNPTAGHVNALQWQAVLDAIEANDGEPVTVAQVAAQYPAGIAAGNAAGFLAYRAKGAKPNVELA